MKIKSILKILTAVTLSTVFLTGNIVPSMAMEAAEVEEAVIETEGNTVSDNASDAGDSTGTTMNEQESGQTEDGGEVVRKYNYDSTHEDFPAVSNDIDYSEVMSELVAGEEDPDSVSSKAMMAAVPSAYPASYNGNWLEILKDKYPATRNQSPYGSCWAHSAMALAEFDIATQTNRPAVDCSELHLAYWTYTQGTASEAGYTGDTVQFAASKWAPTILDTGGSIETAVQTLMRQRGVAREEDVPYSMASEVINGKRLDRSTERNDIYYLKNAYEINIKENPDQIKEAIQKHGAVGVSYEAGNEAAYYNSSTNSFYNYSAEAFPNHAVAVVGWDDNFPAENFNRDANGNLPSRNGAWLIRNSWTTNTSASSDSYFWMSYEDKSLKGAWVLEFTEEFPYDNAYYYDSQIHMTIDGHGSTAANVYTVTDAAYTQKIKAVGFEIARVNGEASEYTIRIYKNPAPEEPDSGELINEATTTGKVIYKGHYTVPLAAPVSLNSGDTFSVVVSLSNTQFCIAEEQNDYMNGVTATVGSKKGQSFYRYGDTGNWTDNTKHDRKNFIITAYTENVDSGPGGENMITLDKKELVFTDKHVTEDIHASAWDAAGKKDKETPIEFSIANPQVASVSTDGQTATISPVSNGKTTLTATYRGKSVSCEVEVAYKAETPKISPRWGPIGVGSKIVLTTETKNAEIYYCIIAVREGEAVPDDEPEDYHRYTQPIRVTEDMRGKDLHIRTYARAVDYEDSDVATNALNVNGDVEKNKAPTPYAQPEGSSEIKVGDKITLRTDGDPGDIYYTINGTDPVKTAENLYIAPIKIGRELAGQTITLKVIFTSDLYDEDSDVLSLKYRVREYSAADSGITISLDKPRVSLAGAGKTQQIKATVYDEDNKAIKDASVAYTSSNTAVATVDNTGLITATGAGTADITVSYGDVNTTCTVTVNHTVRFYVGETLYKEYDNIPHGEQLSNPPADPEGEFKCWADEATGSRWDVSKPITKDLKLTAKFKGDATRSPLNPVPDIESGNLYMVKGQSFTLPTGGNGLVSLSKNIATIAKNGKIAAKAPGTAKIIKEDGSIAYNITVIQPAITNKNLNLVLGETGTVNLQTELNGADMSSEYPVLWTISNPAIATVSSSDSGCSVYALAKGNAVITAYINGKTYTAKVKVSDTRNTNLTSDESSLILQPLQAVTLKLNGRSFKNVTWESSRGMESAGEGKNKVFYDGVVHITSAGKLTAAGPGTTTITCPDNGVKVNVTVSAPTARNIYMNVNTKQTLKYAGVKNNTAIWDCNTADGVIDSILFKSNGTIKAISAGTTNVTCTYDPFGDMGQGFAYETTIYVENPALTADNRLRAANQNKYTLTMDGNSTYELKFEDSGAYRKYQDTVFKSNKPETAYVDEYGVIHTTNPAKKATANLTCTINGKKYTVVLTVMPATV